MDRYDASSSKSSELPASLAFVLQLSRDTGPSLQPFAGRLEHLSTGRRIRFTSLEDFQAAVAQLLQQVKPR